MRTHEFLQQDGGAQGPFSPETKWQGLTVSDRKLPDFLHELNGRITTAWDRELHDHASEPITIDSYKRVARRVGKFSLRVAELAFEWTRSDNARIGWNILFHHVLSSAITAVDRARARFPDAETDWDNELAEGLARTMSIIAQPGYTKERIENLAKRTNTNVYKRAKMTASQSHEMVSAAPTELSFEERAENISLAEELRGYFHLLVPRQFLIMTELFDRDNPKSEAQLASELGVSHQYINYLKQSALRRLNEIYEKRNETVSPFKIPVVETFNPLERDEYEIDERLKSSKDLKLGIADRKILQDLELADALPRPEAQKTQIRLMYFLRQGLTFEEISEKLEIPLEDLEKVYIRFYRRQGVRTARTSRPRQAK